MHGNSGLSQKISQGHTHAPCVCTCMNMHRCVWTCVCMCVLVWASSLHMHGQTGLCACVWTHIDMCECVRAHARVGEFTSVLTCRDQHTCARVNRHGIHEHASRVCVRSTHVCGHTVPPARSPAEHGRPLQADAPSVMAVKSPQEGKRRALGVSPQTPTPAPQRTRASDLVLLPVAAAGGHVAVWLFH